MGSCSETRLAWRKVLDFGARGWKEEEKHRTLKLGEEEEEKWKREEEEGEEQRW
jgi:hypothetical protein